MLTGTCHCGAIHYTITGKIIRFANCHCEDCRRISGATYSSALVVESSGFSISRGEDQLTAYESSPGKHRCFCKNCGAPIVARMASRPELAIVRAGLLDGEHGLKPQMHIWVKAKAPWCEIHDDLPQFAEGFAAK
jgi:hypothetical protein